MRNARRNLIGGVAVVAWLSAMGPASAHVTFVERTAPADSEEIFELNAPVEVDGAHNAAIVAEVPAAFEALYCYAEAGWSCSVEPKTDTAPATLTWTRTSAPAEEVDFVSFGAQTAKKAGEYAFPVLQKYSDGSEMSWSGPKDSEFPAPVITVKG